MVLQLLMQTECTNVARSTSVYTGRTKSKVKVSHVLPQSDHAATRAASAGAGGGEIFGKLYVCKRAIVAASFDAFDVNKDGKLSLTEFHDGLQKLNEDITKEEAQHLMIRLGTNSAGNMSTQDFDCFLSVLEALELEDAVKDAIRTIDDLKDMTRDGATITALDVQRELQTLQVKLCKAIDAKAKKMLKKWANQVSVGSNHCFYSRSLCIYAFARMHTLPDQHRATATSENSQRPSAAADATAAQAQ